mmetsp:Transcript_7083/g.13895  ORF Transcript_7083/g.13895 Transcript_7083/m.13895 type:complete len:138 (-) Transcript_7083:353-766(-)
MKDTRVRSAATTRKRWKGRKWRGKIHHTPTKFLAGAFRNYLLFPSRDPFSTLVLFPFPLAFSVFVGLHLAQDDGESPLHCEEKQEECLPWLFGRVEQRVDKPTGSVMVSVRACTNFFGYSSLLRYSFFLSSIYCHSS